MALEAGTRLGHYEVVSSLGAGGMGEVYRARDTKLGREVAIKLLLEEVSTDPERMARFEREAKVLASLNHTNIASLHAFERDGDTNFLVMELVEGETLADRIKRGAIPVDEALPLFLQIAEGLEAAHEKGIIHRDLKPANIKVTEGGKVKILDFGLAKAMVADEAMGDPSESPTITAAATRRGQIMGTAAYMSPEQASGKPVDRRTDVWAFGVCLWEALTGDRTFGGEDAAHQLAAVLREDIDFSVLPVDSPPALRRLLERCLVRDRRDRLHDIADARLELRQAQDEPSRAGVMDPKAAPLGRRRVLAWAGAAFAVGALLGVSGWAFRGLSQPSAPAAAVSRFALPLPEPLVPSARNYFAVSPDGTRLAYTGSHEGRPLLFLRGLDRQHGTPVEGSEGAWAPFFSPDGESVAFWALGELRRVSVHGGRPKVIGPTRDFGGGSWGRDDRIVFAGLYRLMQISAAGGVPEPLGPIGETTGGPVYPQILPGEQAVLFTVVDRKTDGLGAIAVQSLETGKRRILRERGIYPRYVESGHLVFVQGSSLLAAPFDLDTLELSGPAVEVLQGVMVGGDIAQIAYSRSGMVFFAAHRDYERTLEFVALDGPSTRVPLDEPDSYMAFPRISPDGKRIALNLVNGASRQVGILDLERNVMTQLPGEGNNHGAVWSPSGDRLAFASDRDSVTAFSDNMYAVAADGAGQAKRLVISEYAQWPSSWSPAGLTFTQFHPNSREDVGALPMEGNSVGEPVVVANSPLFDSAASFSPDGRWIAYVTNGDGQDTLYVVPFPGLSPKVTVSRDAMAPVWSRTSQELYFVAAAASTAGPSVRSLMVVSFDTEPIFRPSGPRKVLDVENLVPRAPGQLANYDVHPDGRFLVVKSPGMAPITELNVIHNWFEELKRLVPTD